MFNLATEALLLGVSTGMYCFSQCGLVIIPYIFTDNNTGIKSHSLIVGEFLLGRFIAYTATGLLIGFLGERASATPVFGAARFEIFIGISYIILSALLIFNAIYNRTKKDSCRFNKLKKFSYFPVLLGIFTGINICPPFIAAITKSFETKSMTLGALFFMLFFAATSVFILPLIFSGLLKRIDEIKIISRFVSVLAGIYIGFQGLIYLFNA
jgi:sulfite exporter TauE/SafE